MRHGRFITTAAAAVAALAMGPASALATPGSFTDDSVGDFNAGTHDAGISVVDPGLRLTRSIINQPFGAGPGLPSGLTQTSWTTGTGAATVGNGTLTADGVRVHGDTTYQPDQVLEFRGTFSGAAFQHVGFGNTFEDGPWAIFSTGAGGADLFARTVAVPQTPEDPANVTSVRTALSNPTFDATPPHTYRIEWFANQVKYYVDGALVATHAVTIASAMRPVVSDFTAADGGVVTVSSIGLSLYSATGSFVSQVHYAGAGRVTWGALNAVATTPALTGVAYETRTGQTPNAGDATWSGFQPVVLGGAIQSPSARYIQYRATATTSDNRVTPSLDKVTLSYDLDTSTAGGQSGGTTTGGTPKPGSSGSAVDKTKPKVTLVAKSLKASKKGTVSFTVGCPATEQSCKITLKLKNGTKTVASKTVNVKGGKSKAVTLTLNKATKSLLKKRSSLKVSAVTTATDVAGNTRTATKAMTLRRAAR
jgi:hypothetical protein